MFEGLMFAMGWGRPGPGPGPGQGRLTLSAANLSSRIGTTSNVAGHRRRDVAYVTTPGYN